MKIWDSVYVCNWTYHIAFEAHTFFKVGLWGFNMWVKMCVMSDWQLYYCTQRVIVIKSKFKIKFFSGKLQWGYIQLRSSLQKIGSLQIAWVHKKMEHVKVRNLIFSINHLNTRLVWYSDGQKLSSLQIVQY